MVPHTAFLTTTLQVTENLVLNDHSGLHLGAGPLLLFYSRTSPIHLLQQEEQQVICPRIVKVDITLRV